MSRAWEKIRQAGMLPVGDKVWDQLGLVPSPEPHVFDRLGRGEKRKLVLSFLHSFYGQDGFPSQVVRIEIARKMVQEQRGEFWPEEREIFGRPETNRFILHASIAVWLGGVKSNSYQAIPSWILGKNTSRHFPFLDCLNFVEGYGRDHGEQILPFFLSGEKEAYQGGSPSRLLNLLYLELDMQAKMGEAFSLGSLSSGGCPRELWPRIRGEEIPPTEWRPNLQHCPDFDETRDYWQEVYAPWLGGEIPSCGELLAMADDRLEEARPLVDRSVLKKWERLAFIWSGDFYQKSEL